MTKLQIEMRRASYTPDLGIEQQKFEASTVGSHFEERTIPGHYDVTLTLRNIGQGPATFIRQWSTSVPDNFELLGSDVYPISASPMSDRKARLQLPRDAAGSYVWKRLDFTSKQLLIVECLDVAEGKHQFQILLDGRHPPSLDINPRMVHADGSTFGERLIHLTERMIDISRHLDRRMKKMDEDSFM